MYRTRPPFVSIQNKLKTYCILMVLQGCFGGQQPEIGHNLGISILPQNQKLNS